MGFFFIFFPKRKLLKSFLVFVGALFYSKILDAFSQPRKLYSQFLHILHCISVSEKERKRSPTTKFHSRKKDANIFLAVSQHLCAQRQPENRSEKVHRHLPPLKMLSFSWKWFFPPKKSLTIHELMKELFIYPHQLSTLKTKLAGKPRAMQTLDFFLCCKSKIQWDEN